MKKIIAILIMLVLGWYGNQKYISYKQEQSFGVSEAAAVNHGRTTSESPSDSGPFKCDGRIYCSQMTSCDEAKFFLAQRAFVWVNFMVSDSIRSGSIGILMNLYSSVKGNADEACANMV